MGKPGEGCIVQIRRQLPFSSFLRCRSTSSSWRLMWFSGICVLVTQRTASSAVSCAGNRSSVPRITAGARQSIEAALFLKEIPALLINETQLARPMGVRRRSGVLVFAQEQVSMLRAAGEHPIKARSVPRVTRSSMSTPAYASLRFAVQGASSRASAAPALMPATIPWRRSLTS